MSQNDKQGANSKKVTENSEAQIRTTIHEKWDFLWKDERTFDKRLFLAAFPCFLLTFMLLFFGPLDIFLSNEQYFNVEYTSFLLPFMGVFLGVFILLSVIVALTRGKVHQFLVCLIFGIALCCYIQGNFLNLDLGALDGQSIQWQLYVDQAILNIVVWFFLILAVFGAAYFFDRFAQNALCFLCFLLAAMQGVALVAEMIASKNDASYFLSGNDEYTLSESSNVVVFILDAFSNKVIQDILEENPSALNGFKDFVYFDNYNTGYVGTFPGELFTLTSWEYDFSMTYEENFEAAWSSDRTTSYFDVLKNAGYENRLFSDAPNYICGRDMSRISNVFSNVKQFSHGMINIIDVKQFTKLSLYRYVPQAMKANFWMYSGDITFDSLDADQSESDHRFAINLRENGLKVQGGGKKYITYYMLNGAHGPHTMNRYGNYVEGGTSRIEQAEGYLNVLCDFFDYMKENNIYDDSTIIITSDHGFGIYTQSIFMIKSRFAHADAVQYNHAPVSQQDFVSTILKSLNLPYDDYGPSVFDFKETDERERTVYMWYNDENLPDLHGRYNAMKEFKYIGDGETIDSLVESNIGEIHELIDTFY